MWNLILVRYGEIGLKSEPVRGQMANRLLSHIRSSLKEEDIKEFNVTKTPGRVYVETDEIQEALRALGYVFGIRSFSPCIKVDIDFSEFRRYSTQLLEGRLSSEETFAISARRAGEHPFTSKDIEEKLGDYVRKEFGASVDLDNPDHTLFVEVRDDNAYLFLKKIEGLHGLPIGSQGKVVSLFSGGIDSPVASTRLMKRGCRVIPVYMDKGRFDSGEMKKRTVEVKERLSRYSPYKMNLIEVDFEEIMQVISENVFRLTCILCKRSFYRLAEAVAEKIDAKGVVTGESIGQVASQTLDNLYVLNEAVDLPVFRPLIGFDKIESESISRELGFYEASSRNVGECRALPNKVSTSADLKEVKELEDKIQIKKYEKKALEKTNLRKN
ncbi:MAG: tRNA S(4)U 4-thiouridine synthase ThiI [Candidatus Methanohalarchaeum thermophilum]|uniref:Probable tRNA sulfurtransferase n=1 Tax=Methanohalarchaeum thermophilum TaxID=1903181 RepID=A0A1Q6DSI3_METT1|nr:MAG: tRNA S(4)U 4-thiouridine synthase ThiI [Candidatus Methanohalarchaeum thermophilum]